MFFVIALAICLPLAIEPQLLLTEKPIKGIILNQYVGDTRYIYICCMTLCQIAKSVEVEMVNRNSAYVGLSCLVPFLTIGITLVTLLYIYNYYYSVTYVILLTHIMVGWCSCFPALLFKIREEYRKNK